MKPIQQVKTCDVELVIDAHQDAYTPGLNVQDTHPGLGGTSVKGNSLLVMQQSTGTGTTLLQPGDH
jgi:hypothetical protein